MAVALQTFPTNRNDANEAEWNLLGSGLAPNGVIWGARNSFAVYADSTGLQVKVPTGRAIVSGFMADMPAQQTLAVDTPHATNTRIDRVILRCDLNTPVTVSLLILTGSPSSTPVPPALNSTDLPLAQVVVDPLPSASIAAGKVTRERLWSGTSLVTSYSASMHALSGWTPYISGGDVRAHYTVRNGIASVWFRGLVGMSGVTSGPDYGVGLPILPKFAGDGGSGRVQNTAADVSTLLTPGTNGSVQLLTSTHTALDAGHAYYDAFNIEYQIAG